MAISARDTVARTLAGPVAGRDHDGVVEFRGIPFAAAPTGARRWRPPSPAPEWTAVRDCSHFGPICPQNMSPVEVMLGNGSRPQSEDCLTLNIWTPAVDDAGRAVMVWLHGGGFIAGAGSIPWYDGTRLALAGDVVVVTFNYRLGVFGYLHLEDHLGPEFTGSGNCGLLDQVAALQWVRDNIAAFGGDPGRVTVFGESAGAMSIGALLGTPAAGGLFQGAIAQSGAAHNVLAAETASHVTAELLAHLGLASHSVAALLDVPVDRLLAAQATVANRLTALTAKPPPGTRRARWTLAFQPVVDGAVLPAPPLEAVAAGSAAGVALITGSTAEEWNLFHLPERQAGPMTFEGLVRRCEALLAPSHGAGYGEHAAEVYRSGRPGADPDEIWIAVATDWVFRIPAIRLAEAQVAHQPATYMYAFSYRSPAWGGLLGACHAMDVPFAFDNLHRPGVELMVGPIGDDARRVAAITSGAWLAMSRSLSPGHEGLPEWPGYELGRRLTMDLGPQPVVHEDPGAAERELWVGAL